MLTRSSIGIWGKLPILILILIDVKKYVLIRLLAEIIAV